MKKILIFFLIFFGILSCNSDKNIPDVSGITIDVTVKRFEKDFFAMDTSNLVAGLNQLQQKYPGFTNDFINNVLGLDITALMNKTDQQINALKNFLRDYLPVKDSADMVFGDFEKEVIEIRKGLQFLKYYFPNYHTPSNIITFIGPIDAFFQTSFGTQGDIITKDGLGIGLQLHLGSNFSFYRSEQGLQQYPDYISETFTPEYIAVNSMKNIIDDIYSDKSIGRPLIEQMIEKGKRLYLLDKLLPNTPDHIKISYTEKKIKDAYNNEAVIWDFFLTNDLLNNTEPNMIKNFIGESPKTQELGEDSPGNIGSFTGWQIVKKFMNKNPEISLNEMMNMDPRELYILSKYKPKP